MKDSGLYFDVWLSELLLDVAGARQDMFALCFNRVGICGSLMWCVCVNCCTIVLLKGIVYIPLHSFG